MAVTDFLNNIDLTGLQAYLAGSAKASQNANEAEGRYYNARDAVNAALYGTSSSAATNRNAQALNNAKFTTSLPGVGASEAVRGSLIKNVQDVHSEAGVPGLTTTGPVGGERPSDLTPEARQAGADLIAHGQSLIANPNSFAPALERVDAPALSPEPKAGFWGQAAADSATALGLLNALMPKKAGVPGVAGAPSGGDLGSLINWLKGNKPTSGNTGQPTGDFTHNLDNPADPTGSVSAKVGGADVDPNVTSGSDDAGGYYNPDGSYVPPDWWTPDPGNNSGPVTDPTDGMGNYPDDGSFW